MIRIEPTMAPTPCPRDEADAFPAAENRAQAELLLLDLIDVMEELLAVVEEETQFVRAGCGDAAARLQHQKTELARRYVTAITAVQASQDYLCRAMPDAVATLRVRHDTFRALLQINLTVLAVESAVADGARTRAEAAEASLRTPDREFAPRRRLPDVRGWPFPASRAPLRVAYAEAAPASRRRLP